jgi:hypothetical protein
MYQLNSLKANYRVSTREQKNKIGSKKYIKGAINVITIIITMVEIIK